MRRAERSPELSTVQERVERWRRRSGGRGSRIPDDLWDEAAGVARVEGVWATARALHMNYERLRKRVEAEVGVRKPKRKMRTRNVARTPSEFVDLGPAALGGGGRTVLDLERQDGERLRIDVSDPSRVDVVALARALWSRRP
jgi:hypothetical protein